MEQLPEKTPAEWFAAADQWYLEGHQGCVNCGGCHCVFRSESETHVEFYCYTCDFSVCRQMSTGRHYVWGDGKVERQPCAILEHVLKELNGFFDKPGMSAPL